MTDELIKQLQRLNEGLFKPITKGDKRLRFVARKEELKKLGVKLTYLQEPIINKLDSFWYSGDVARVEYTSKDGENRVIVISAQGDIKVKIHSSSDDEKSLWYRDGRAVEEAERRGCTDANLGTENSEHTFIWFESNNWFEFFYGSSKWEDLHDVSVMEGGETYDTYLEAVSSAVDIIMDTKAWHGYTMDFIKRKR
jgi:hypothetical protein